MLLCMCEMFRKMFRKHSTEWIFRHDPNSQCNHRRQDLGQIPCRQLGHSRSRPWDKNMRASYLFGRWRHSAMAGVKETGQKKEARTWCIVKSLVWAAGNQSCWGILGNCAEQIWVIPCEGKRIGFLYCNSHLSLAEGCSRGQYFPQQFRPAPGTESPWCPWDAEGGTDWGYTDSVLKSAGFHLQSKSPNLKMQPWLFLFTLYLHFSIYTLIFIFTLLYFPSLFTLFSAGHPCSPRELGYYLVWE